MKLVVKIGGSVLFDDYGPKTDYIKRLLPVLKKIKKENQFILTIGGGVFVKNYEKRALNFLERRKVEESSIHILRANAVFFSHLLETKPLFSLGEIGKASEGVIGGIVPGRSTDANAAFCASVIGADLLVKLTNVDGVYDKDPKKFKSARLLEKIKFCDLQKVLKKDKDDYSMLDATAQEIIVSNRIKTVIANGYEPKNLMKILNNEKTGTSIE